MVEINTDYDVIIAGGGPAGLSSLLWCADLGLNAILLEKNPEFGGQLLHIYNAIENYLGIEAANGRELRDIFLRQVANLKTKCFSGAEIVEADLRKKCLTLADGTEYSSRSIIIATGVRRRKLAVLGEEEFRGRGILESGVKGKNEVIGKNVVVVGGGDAALENALILSETAHKVFVVHRSSEFKARTEFVRRAKIKENVEFCLDNRITKICGNETVEWVELAHLNSGEISRIETDAILIRIGVEPNTELFRGQIELDEAGHVVIESTCTTSLPNIFAAGDVANRFSPTICAAVGQGSAAVKQSNREKNFH